MFSAAILSVAICGQIGPPQFIPGGFTYRVAPRAVDPDTGLPVPWNVYQWKMQQKQLEIERGIEQAEQERLQAQQARLKARKANLKAKTAAKPDVPDAPRKAILSKQEREAQIQRNLAKNRTTGVAPR